MPFSRDISPKENITIQLELELVYFEAAIQHFNHYTIGYPHFSDSKGLKKMSSIKDIQLFSSGSKVLFKEVAKY